MNSDSSHDDNFSTQAIHAGQEMPDGQHVLIVPLVFDSVFPINDVDEGIAVISLESKKGYVYSRYSNPTVDVLEKKMALLDGAEAALAVSTGMMATWLLVTTFLKTGEHVIAHYSTYHEITDLFAYLSQKFDFELSLINTCKLQEIEQVIRPETRLLFRDTPSNPLLEIADIQACSQLTKKHNIILVVDNSVLTPYLQKPIRWGADVTLYSTTKFIGGHGDTMGGILCGSQHLIDEMRELCGMTGSIMQPFEAWLTIRGIKTLAARLDKCCANALKLALFLSTHPKIDKVIYPCLNRSSLGSLTEQMEGYGGIVTCEVAGGKAGANRFIRNLKLCRLAAGFGNLETLVYHFATFTRPVRDISRIGLSDATVRCSVGIENIEDIIQDFDQALRKV